MCESFFATLECELIDRPQADLPFFDRSLFEENRPDRLDSGAAGHAWKAVPRGKAGQQLNTKTAHTVTNISWGITLIRTNWATAIIGSKRHMRTTSSLLAPATLLNYAWFRFRCTAPRGMDEDANMPPSTCAIIGGGTSATANTCAGVRNG
jgi:hypothetical protein